MRLIPTPPSYIKSGSIMFDGKVDITKLSNRQMEKIRGSEMGMIFQDPMTSLNPTMKIGDQITEGLIKHEGLNKERGKRESDRNSQACRHSTPLRVVFINIRMNSPVVCVNVL